MSSMREEAEGVGWREGGARSGCPSRKLCTKRSEPAWPALGVHARAKREASHCHLHVERNAPEPRPVEDGLGEGHWAIFTQDPNRFRLVCALPLRAPLGGGFGGADEVFGRSTGRKKARGAPRYRAGSCRSSTTSRRRCWLSYRSSTNGHRPGRCRRWRGSRS
jgi:hypothetical protein